jgi:hypothetical protein
MRQLLLTVLLALLAAVFGTLAAVQLKDNNLSALFGAPPLAKGDRLYDFDAAGVARLVITNSSGERASFSRSDGLWRMTEPSRDRADYRHLEGLVEFTRNLRIEDIIPADGVAPEEFGFRAGSFDFELIDLEGRRVARFGLGRRTAWHRFDSENNRIFETVFIQPREAGRKGYAYVCSAPEVRRSLLDRGFGVLRDHHPFLFSWKQLASVQVRNSGGELLLSRESPQGGWKITKPLTLRTDPEAVAALLRKLTELEATTVHDPGSVTTIDPESPYLSIALGAFAADGSVVPAATLTIEPPATPEAGTVFAHVAGRPAVFELPLTPVNGHPGVSQLESGINDLRSKTLADLNIAALSSITIDAPHLPRPLIVTLGKARQDGRPRWLVRYGNNQSPANEFTVEKLLSAVTRDQVTGFASDAATDLAAFGLDFPEKRVLFEGGSGEGIELLFGRSGEKFHAMRKGTPSVVEIDSGTYTRIAAHPHEWRDPLLWPFNVIDLVGLRIERKGREPLNLTYNFLDESWTARQGDTDVTPLLNTQRANNFLTFLENLRVTRWLGVDSTEAQRALADPVFSLTVLYKQINDLGDPVGVTPVTLEVARASLSPQNRIFYGRLSGDPDYFVLDLEAARRLATDLLEATASPGVTEP